MPFRPDDAVRLLRIRAVQAAALDVRRVVREACSGGG